MTSELLNEMLSNRHVVVQDFGKEREEDVGEQLEKIDDINYTCDDASGTESKSKLMGISSNEDHDMDDDAGEDSGAAGDVMAYPEVIPAEPGLFARFSNRFQMTLNNNSPSFKEVESLIPLE